MKIEKLLRQKEAIEAQIRNAEFAQKNRAKVEKLVLKSLQKHPEIFAADLKILAQKFDENFAAIAGNLANFPK